MPPTARCAVAAFDLDGTLLRGSRFEYAWQAVWSDLQFDPEVPRALRRDYLTVVGADPSPSTVPFSVDTRER